MFLFDNCEYLVLDVVCFGDLLLVVCVGVKLFVMSWCGVCVYGVCGWCLELLEFFCFDVMVLMFVEVFFSFVV